MVERATSNFLTVLELSRSIAAFNVLFWHGKLFLAFFMLYQAR